MFKVPFETPVLKEDFTIDVKDYENLVSHFEQIEMNREISVKDLMAIKKVRYLIKKYNPDIVYAHSSKAGAIARVANIGIRNYCIYNPHGWAFKKSKIVYYNRKNGSILLQQDYMYFRDGKGVGIRERYLQRR